MHIRVYTFFIHLFLFIYMHVYILLMAKILHGPLYLNYWNHGTILYLG